MSDRSPDTQDTPLEATQNGKINPSRRKLTGAALGVSAIFTLASRPVLAVQCMSPSSAASGNLSHYGAAPMCTGRTPAQWVAHAQATNSSNPNHPNNNGFPGDNVKFHDVFSSGTSANWGNNTRLYEVMTTANATNKPNPISAEFAATLLNIRDGRIPGSILTETNLIGMWNEWRTSGGFTPKAGATPWNADTIVWYLRTLQGA